MAALTYMQRRVSGTYEFRRRLPEMLAGKEVPAHMREAFRELINTKTGRFKRELVRSLNTKDLREAKRRDHREALRGTQLFEDALKALRGASVETNEPFDVDVVAEEVLAELLRGDEAERIAGDDRRHLQTPTERAKWPELLSVPPGTSIGMTEDHFHAYGHLISELEQEYRQALARRDPKIVFPETNIVLKRRGIYLDKTSGEFQMAALAVLKAHVRAYDAIIKRQGGRDIPTPPVASIVSDRGPKLSAAFEIWKQGGTAAGARSPGANTITEAEQAVRYFIELHGDIRLGDITRVKAREFRDAIAKVPRALPRKLRRLPLPQLLEHELTMFEPRQATTVHKLLQILAAIVSKAEREGLLDTVAGFVNPFGKGIRYSIEQHELTRKLFDKGDLKAIFASPIFAKGLRPQGGGREAAFWFPLIGLLSGLRLDEIAQLRVCDVRQDDDTDRWLFDVGRDGGRSTKTSSSVRLVPMHRELERIGLLVYRQSLINAGAGLQDSLWPAIKTNSERSRSAAWSKWFGRYLRETCGIRDRAKVFHSFRHTFKRMCRDAGLLEEHHDALTGHADNGSVGRSYGQGLSTAILVNAIDALVPPIALHGLRWSA